MDRLKEEHTSQKPNRRLKSMPAKSKSQQNAFGVALAARRGDIPPESLEGSAKLLFRDKTLTDNQLSDYAETKTDLPQKRQFGRTHKTFKRG